MEEKKKSGKAGLVVIIVILLLIICGMGTYIFINKDNTIVKNSVTNDKPNNNQIKCKDDQITSYDKRFYAVENENQKQRYQLLLDDATYGAGQNFLERKTYILDLNMVKDNNSVLKEVNLSEVLKPFVDKYINENKGNAQGTCTIEYFGTDGVTLQIDREKEVAFKGYYNCYNGAAETSLGSNLYAYNVENNTIRDMGKIG